MKKISEMKGVAFDGKAMGYVPPKKLSISGKLKLHKKTSKTIDPVTYEVVRSGHALTGQDLQLAASWLASHR